MNSIPQKSTVSTKILFALEIFNIIASIWLIVYPKPYIILFSVVLCIPFCRLLLHTFNKKYLSATTNKGSKYNDITDFLDLATVAITYRVLVDAKIAVGNHGTIGYYTFLLFFTFLLFHLLIIKTPINRTLLMIALNIAIYSYSAACAINKIYDNKTTTIYKPLITKKWISGRTNKKGTPYLQLSAWKQEPYGYEIAVSDIGYQTVKVGDTILVYGHQGFLGASWYELEDKIK